MDVFCLWVILQIQQPGLENYNKIYWVLAYPAISANKCSKCAKMQIQQIHMNHLKEERILIQFLFAFKIVVT